MAGNPRIPRFPTRGGLVGQNITCKKVADNHPGQRGNFDPLRLGIPSTSKLCFSVFGLGPEFLQVPPAQILPKTR